MTIKTAMDWRSVSEVCFGLVVTNRLDMSKFNASMFCDGYEDAFTEWFKSKNKTAVAKKLGADYEVAIQAADTISDDSAKDVEWHKILRRSALNYQLGEKTERISKKLKQGYEIDSQEAVEIAGAFKDVANPDCLGLSVSNTIDVDAFEPTELTGYLPVDLHLGGMVQSGNILVMGTTGVGKCFAPGTKVLMFDGNTIPIEDIQIGDKVMGPDSSPRTVISLAHGYDEMYEVTPVKGESYVVNSEHILSLKMSAYVNNQYQQGDIINIPVKDYLQQTKTFKHFAKGWRTGVHFSVQEPYLTIDPYFLGIWLADGSKNTMEVTSNDFEVIEYLHSFAESWGMHVRQNGKYTYCLSGTYQNNKPELLNAMRELGVINNKHIPMSYKTNTWYNRMQLLAGILDGDGYIQHGCFDIVQKVEQLADDIVYLARSLGFAAYKHKCEKHCQNNGGGTYYRITISGNISEIPCKVSRRISPERIQIKDHLVTGITVNPVGYGEYFGFNLDGDGLFLLGDFTVTHNSLFTQQFWGHWLDTYKDRKIAVWSLEMTNQQYLYRGLKLFPKFRKAHEEGRVLVSDKTTTIYDIGIEAAAAGVDAIVVDYIDYLVRGEPSEGKFAEIYIEMNNISRNLHIPFMMILQPNRQSYTGGVPKMYHARYSGMAENVSAQFWVTYRPKDEDDTNGDFTYVEDSMYLVAWKQRFGWMNAGRCDELRDQYPDHGFDGRGRKGPGAIVLPCCKNVWSDEPGEWLVHGELPQSMKKNRRGDG